MTKKQNLELSEKKRQLLETLLKAEGLNSPSKSTITKRKDSDRAPLSFAQERLWFLHQLVPESPVYNIPAGVRLHGQLNIEILEKSLNEIVRRHEILRTTFVRTEKGPVQIINPKLTLKVSVIDLLKMNEAEREAQALKLANIEAQKPFDLAKGPLLRATIFHIHDEDYIFLITMHHIISEVWSLTILFKELEVLYEAYLKGQKSPLPELSIQYADFASWQRQWFRGEVLEKELEYWKEQLGGEVPILQLPTDYPRPAVQTFNGAWQSHILPKSLMNGLRNLSQKENTTLFMTLLAAYATLLYRYTGQEDIIIGSPVAGRNWAETEDLIGFFVNTLALRVDLSEDPGFRELLGRVREMALAAYSHQDLPFEKLIEELSPERDISYTPLFQVMFTLQNSPVPTLKLYGMSPGLPMSSAEIHNGATKTDLALIVEETSEGLVAAFEYNTDLFEKATIDRMLNHFHNLLESILANPDQNLSSLKIMSPSEVKNIIQGWNETRTDYPAEKCIHELFREQVNKHPDSIAIIYGDEKLTYRELDQRANRLGNYLQKMKIKPEDFVAISMEPSVDMVVAILGILKAGGAYVPLDPTYPAERNIYMLKDTGASIIISQQSLIEKLPVGRAKIICLDTEWKQIEQESTENPVNQVTPNNLAYVMYTSGSTGHPKGICVPHKAVVRLVCNTDYINLKSSDRIAQASNASFDAVTFEIWGALLNGATLVGMGRDIVLSPREFASNLHKYKITTLFLTTALFNEMAKIVPDAFGSLHHLLFGGEAVDTQRVAQVKQENPPERLLHVYGPTENTTFSTWYEVKEVPDCKRTVPIGRAIANSEIYVLDQKLNPVPVGVVGELYVGGDGLARNYLNQPALTAEKFLPHPFGKIPGSRLYRTGDLVRWRSDGNLEFIGRVDHQVKLRGFRIELTEIESVLRQHPAISENVVLLREDQRGEKRLVAYIVFKKGEKCTINVLRNFLKDKLPEYMIPSAYVFLEKFPLTPNGKVDRKSLPVPEGVRPALKEAYIAPRTELERIIAEVWKEVFQVDRVGLNDNFFDLGGHSLLLTQVHSKLQYIFNTKISMIDMFKYPTVSSLADFLSNGENVSTVFQQSQDRANIRRELMQRRKHVRKKAKETQTNEDEV
ncbi:MAG: amino acid adenylation domain-containing protein [Calditrichaeota bacterium]|nr:MAG: amino acid adenylation domain-containing protein [Calditrichota bacterium]